MKLSVITALALITSLSYSASARAADPEKFFVHGHYEKACDTEPTQNWWLSYNRSAFFSTLAEANDHCTLAVHPTSQPEPVETTEIFNLFDAEQGKCRGAVRVEYTCSPHDVDAIYSRKSTQVYLCSEPRYDESVWLRDYNPETDRAVHALAKRVCAGLGRPNVELVQPLVRGGRARPVLQACEATSEITFRCRE